MLIRENLNTISDGQNSVFSVEGEDLGSSVLLGSAPETRSASLEKTSLSWNQLPEQLRQRISVDNRKLKIEILECEGGAGHKMSAEAVKQAVERHFGKENVDITKYDVGSHLAPDPLSLVTFGRYSVIQLHNYLARNGHVKLISVMSKIGRIASRLQSPFTRRHFQKRYKKDSPDLVISTIPLINGVVLSSLKKQNIPLMVVSTDGDNRLFSANWHKGKDLGPYRYGIPYNSLEIARKVSKHVDMEKVRGIGYPLREGYTQTYSPSQKADFKAKHLLTDVDHYVGFMMGGLGGKALQNYHTTVLKSVEKGELEKPNTRFAFFCGNNVAMRKTLLKKLEKRKWCCDLSGGRSEIIENCNHQLKTLRRIDKCLLSVKNTLKSDQAISSEKILKLSQLRKQFEDDRSLHVESLELPLKAVMEMGWSEMDRLIDELKNLHELADLNEENFSQVLNKTQETVVAVRQAYGNIIDDATVYRHESGASVTIQGFTSQDHEYVAVSDLWVTKTGSSTFNQCIYQQVPMLLDGTADALSWENLNFELGETYRFSETVSSYKTFFSQLNEMLKPEVNEKYRAAEKKYLDQRPKQAQFSRNIVNLSYELLNEAEQRRVEQAEKQSEDERLKVERNTVWKSLGSVEKVKKIFDSTFVVVADIIFRVFKIVFSIFLGPIFMMFKKISNYAFFSGFNCPPSRQKKRRQRLIREKNAEPIEGDSKPLSSPESNRAIDALRIPSTSQNPTGNAIIFVLGKHYQDYHPQNYDHLLEDGADVILFNPSKNDTKTMAADLKELIKELRNRNPHQKLALHGYCIGGHVATAVAADIASGQVEGINAESIPAIIDRGFEDAHNVASFSNKIADLPILRNFINRNYNARSSSIEKHKAPMLFVTPIAGEDQVNHKKKRNFTLEIMARHTQGMNQVVQLVNGDHWSAWPVKVHNTVKKFLSKQGIIGTTYRKVDANDFGGVEKLKNKTSVPWVRRNVVPVFV